MYKSTKALHNQQTAILGRTINIPQGNQSSRDPHIPKQSLKAFYAHHHSDALTNRRKETVKIMKKYPNKLIAHYNPELEQADKLVPQNQPFKPYHPPHDISAKPIIISNKIKTIYKAHFQSELSHKIRKAINQSRDPKRLNKIRARLIQLKVQQQITPEQYNMYIRLLRNQNNFIQALYEVTTVHNLAEQHLDNITVNGTKFKITYKPTYEATKTIFTQPIAPPLTVRPKKKSPTHQIKLVPAAQVPDKGWLEIQTHMLAKKGYQLQYNPQLLQDYINNNLDKLNPKYREMQPKAALATATKQAINGYCSTVINKHYNTQTYMVLVDTTEHINITEYKSPRDGRPAQSEKHFTKEHKGEKPLAEQSIKKLLQHANVTIILYDINTGTTLAYRNTKALRYWDDINNTANQLIFQLHAKSLMESQDNSDLLEDQELAEYNRYKELYYDMVEPSKYVPKFYTNGNYTTLYINWSTQPTKQDLENARYMIENKIIHQKYLTDAQVEELKSKIELARHHMKIAYQLGHPQLEQLREKYEALMLRLDQDNQRKTETSSYIDEFQVIHRADPEEYTLIEYNQSTQSPEVYEDFYYKQQHNYLDKSYKTPAFWESTTYTSTTPKIVPSTTSPSLLPTHLGSPINMDNYPITLELQTYPSQFLTLNSKFL